MSQSLATDVCIDKNKADTLMITREKETPGAWISFSNTRAFHPLLRNGPPLLEQNITPRPGFIAAAFVEEGRHCLPTSHPLQQLSIPTCSSHSSDDN